MTIAEVYKRVLAVVGEGRSLRVSRVRDKDGDSWQAQWGDGYLTGGHAVSRSIKDLLQQTRMKAARDRA